MNTTTAQPSSPRNAPRRRWLAIVIGAFVLAIGAYGAWYQTVLRYEQTTDDAYVGGNVVQVTPQVAGTVVGIKGDDTQFVQAGTTLVELDPADAKIALEEAEARLAKAVREVRGLFATTAQLDANVSLRQADVARVTEDLARRERIAATGAVSGEELQHARDALSVANAALGASRQELAANRARIDRTTIADHPDVLAASAAVHDAYLAYARTRLPAPVSGYIAKRSVQLGQRVAPGAPLMAIVPLDNVWVDANFKESQLAALRVGQPAEVKADLYGRTVAYHGTVAGFGAGTGAAFALLPAQNATGNWIKVVQRIPVRIALDRKELAANPLQVGLSMQVDIDTHQRDGVRLPQVAGTATSGTAVFASSEDEARARVASIIAANTGLATGSAANASTRLASAHGGGKSILVQ